MDKRKEFKKKIAIVTTTAAIVAGGFTLNAASKNEDLSQYMVSNNKYEDYIKGSEYKKFKKMEELDNNISKYEALKSRMFLDKEEKNELEELSKAIKEEMSSGDLADFYLNDLLKEKLKEAYHVESVVTNYSNDGEIKIDLYGKNKISKTMENKDEVTPIKIAMRDIATLQGYIGREEFSNQDVKEFIKMQKNMKGFSNLKFIKEEGKPLAYAQIELEKGEEIEF